MSCIVPCQLGGCSSHIFRAKVAIAMAVRWEDGRKAMGLAGNGALMRHVL